MGKVGQMPVLSSLVGHPDLPAYFPTFMEQLETANARTPVPSWPAIDEAISNAVLKALRGDMEVQAALDEAAAIVDGLLAEYYRRLAPDLRTVMGMTRRLRDHGRRRPAPAGPAGPCSPMPGRSRVRRLLPIYALLLPGLVLYGPGPAYPIAPLVR